MVQEAWAPGPDQPETVFLPDLLLRHQQPRRDEEGGCRSRSSYAAVAYSMIRDGTVYREQGARLHSIAFIRSSPDVG
jgi:hypothetical protein